MALADPNFTGSPPLTHTRLDLILHGNRHMRRGMLLLGEPCHCVCTNALLGLSATAEFLVSESGSINGT